MSNTTIGLDAAKPAFKLTPRTMLAWGGFAA